MTREYSPLTHAALAAGARLAAPQGGARASLDDPALSVMTDLRDVAAVTTTAETPIGQANGLMIRRGVRLLFVLDASGVIAGVLTATDLLGEKPVRFMQERGVSHSEVLVGDLMTPASGLEALALQDVQQMRVGHVVATLKAVRRQHLLVGEERGTRVRGIFSASHIARQLGVELHTTDVASTFADIEAALAR